MDPMAIIDKYYPSGTALNRILVDHSRQVAEKSLEIAWNLADPDRKSTRLNSSHYS